jgi:hypothetical protein
VDDDVAAALDKRRRQWRLLRFALQDRLERAWPVGGASAHRSLAHADPG